MIVASADESHAIFYSIGNFAGSTQSALENYYYGERAEKASWEGEWATSPFVQPPGLVDHAVENIQAEGKDLTEGLFAYQSSSTLTPSEANFYIRGLPDGTPVEVGPAFSAAVLAASRNGNVVSTASASDDLSHVLFSISGPSLAGQEESLWPGDTTVNNSGPLWGRQGFVSLYEYSGLANSSPALVGVDDQGHLISQCGTALGFPSKGNFSAYLSAENYNAISNDGARVFFTAAAASQGPSQDACTEQQAGHGPPANELFARVNGVETIGVSEPSTGPGGDCSACDVSAPMGAVFQGASEDGSKAFFLSEQHMLAGAEGMNLYEYDFDAATGSRVALVAPNVQGVARVSEDGSRVYFVAQDTLTGTPNPVGVTPTLGADNLYVYERDEHYPDGHIAFIGTLTATDEKDWAREDGRPVDAASSDGRFLVFTSSADLTPDDTSGVAQVFEYDAEKATLVRVSVGQSGFNNDGNTHEYPASIASPSYDGSDNPAPQPSSVSDDGAYVVFQSSDALTPFAAAGYNNVYEYHAGQVSLISDGEDRTFRDGDGTFRAGEPLLPSTALIGIDASGQDIFFESADRLIPQDGDTQIDVYDARADGGFSPPITETECHGEGCQGSLSQTPLFSTPVSSTQPAGEQFTEPSIKPATKAKQKKKKRSKPHHKTKHVKKAEKADHESSKAAVHTRSDHR